MLKTNPLGDVTAIYDLEGNLVARYEYDAWGNHQVYDAQGNLNEETEFVGNLNPIRYRNYYYDQECKLFYCNARYYDPEVGRWISPDDLSYLNPDSITGLNLYVYCADNPMMFVDNNGCFISAIFGTIFGALWGGISAAVNGGNFLAGAAAGAIGGFISGIALDAAAVTGGVGGLIIAGIVGALGGFAGDVLGQAWVDGKSINEIKWGQAILSGVITGVTNVLTFGVGLKAFDSKNVPGAGFFKNLTNQLTKATGVEFLANTVFGWIAPFIGATPGIVNGKRSSQDMNQQAYA